MSAESLLADLSPQDLIEVEDFLRERGVEGEAIPAALRQLAQIAASECATCCDDSSAPLRLLDSFDVAGVAAGICAGTYQNVCVMAGAGISVSAGIPDFRTPGSGLYDNLAKYNLPSPQAIFSLDFFKANPAPFYHLAKELYPGSFAPTPTHYFLRLLHEKGILRRVFTQNIDSLEALAGLPKDMVIAAHGNFDSAKCVTTGLPVGVDEVREAILRGEDGWQGLRERHGGLVKPNIVFFGEPMPREFFDAMSIDLPECDLLIVMGTSLQVQPFASVINKVGSKVPRLLVNREIVGEKKGGIMAMLTGECTPYSFGSAHDVRTLQGRGRSTGRTEGFDFAEASNYRDAIHLGDCDAGSRALAAGCGWQQELERMCIEGYDALLQAGEVAMPVCFAQRGLCHSELGNSAAAVADFKRALELEPELAVAQTALARLASSPEPVRGTELRSAGCFPVGVRTSRRHALFCELPNSACQ